MVYCTGNMVVGGEEGVFTENPLTLALVLSRPTASGIKETHFRTWH